MPLARCQIRNEYALADPELYRAADKDDPEAILEGVAMAGLVGVLRQLGDLAEFAAEIFHGLHEEVMATAARGHCLMARVQQLEAEVPSIEKAFLSQTDPSPFFTNTGVDWRPNLRMEQNVITHGDLPRFVMDSYEECRGPPRLFLLDKFDVAGAGACLKRYTDPSVFKVEDASSGVEVQREKKIRKVKKKGSRWRNGDTPEVAPTSHAKLHQLFLEERVENAHSDPARIVKLKQRQLNVSPFDLKPGKSYMENFLGTLSPEHKVVCEVPVCQSPLKLTLDNSSESALEILEIGTVSPARESSKGRESIGSSPTAQEVAVKTFTHESGKEGIPREMVKVPDPISSGEGPYVIHKMAIGDEWAVDGDRKTEESVDGDNSDDLMSEVDNYMDALTTMESEMDTDNEYKPKNGQGSLKIRKQGTDSDTIDEHLDVCANFSDSQSFGNSSISDEGKSSLNKGRSSFSCSDSLSNVAENTSFDNEQTVKAFSFKNCAVKKVDSLPDHPSFHAENRGIQSSELIVYNNMYNDEGTIPYAGETANSSFPSDSSSLLPPPVPLANSITVPAAETVLDEPSSDRIKLPLESQNSDQNGTRVNSNLPAVSSKDCPIEEVVYENPNLFVHTPNISDPEREGDDDCINEMLQTDNADEIYDESLGEGKLDSPHLVISSSRKQFLSSVSPEVDVDAGVSEVSDGSDAVNPAELDLEVNDLYSATGISSELLTGVAEPLEVDAIKQQCSDITVDASQDEHEVKEVDREVDIVGRNTTSLENLTNGLDKLDLDDHQHLDNDVVLYPVAVSTGGNDGVSDANCLVADMACSQSSNLVDIQESLSRNQDSHRKGLDSDEVVLLVCCTESEKQKEVKQLEVVSSDAKFNPYKSVSDGTDKDGSEHVHKTGLPDQTQNGNTSYVADVTTISSSEVNNQELESHLKCSVDSNEHHVSSPAYHLPDVGTALEHSAELEADWKLVEPSFTVMHEKSSELYDVQQSTICHLAEPGIPSGQSLELQSDKLDTGWSQATEASSKSSNLPSEQLETGIDTGQERCVAASSKQEALPNQGHFVRSAAEEVSGTVLSQNPFASVFSSFGPVPENLEEMPPLPPLPPMQWRLGKFQPAPLASHTERTDHDPTWFLPTQPFTTDKNSDTGSVSLYRQSMQPSNSFLFATSADIQRSEHLSPESVGSSLQPTSLAMGMPTVATDANNQRDSLPLEEMPSLNPLLYLPEASNEEPEGGFLSSRTNPERSSSDPLSPVEVVEHMQTEHDPEPLLGVQIKYLNQATPDLISEAKTPETGLQNLQVGEGNSLDESASQSTLLEDQSQHDFVTSYGEITWSQTTLALPPTYEVGKANGSKLPRPRNPLIDAVAAHDKSKLRKVTERVHPQVGPKVGERDSLLQQIRTQSFNLKPTAVTRPSIQGIRGPKTNLKVAAILEKANAIRQALAGSDEDDDSDSWSDS